MHKYITPTNVTQTLFRVEENGVKITNTIVFEIKNDGTLISLNHENVGLNYIKIPSQLNTNSKVLIVYDISNDTSVNTEIKKLQEEIKGIKEALINRVSHQEIDQYIEKLRQFSTL